MEASSFDHRRMEAMKELVRGQDLAGQLQKIMSGGGSPSAEDAADKLVTSFTNALSMLSDIEPDDCCQVSDGHSNPTPKSEDSSEGSSKRKNGRGCYKRRSYYRCTHKFEQKCLATKQVQMISKDPPMYQSTYYGRHTCNDLLNSPQIIVGPEDEDAKNIVSFSSNAASSQNNPFFSPLSFGSIKEEPRQETASCGDHSAFCSQSPSPSDCDFLMECWAREVDQPEDFMLYGSY